MERYEYLNGPPSPRMVAELAMRHDALIKQLADAQATIAALQAERDGWVRSREHYYQLWIRAIDERDEMRKERDDFESQLTQRTAELEALRPLYDDMWKQFAESQAELERVRGELVEAAHNVNVYQSLYSTGCMDRALLENELRDIRTLIAANKETKHDAI